MRENPLIILWLDNLGVFYPHIGELGLNNIAAAFEGATVVHILISPIPSVTESAEVVMKAGCSLDLLPVLGEVTFDRAAGKYINIKQTEFNRETGAVTPIQGAPKLADFVSPALSKRLISNLGFTICQIGANLGSVGSGRVIALTSNEAIQLEHMASYDIIPMRIQALLQAMQNYEADLYFLNISGDAIVHNEGLAGQASFMKRLDKEFPSLIDGLAEQAKEYTLIMFSDHGPRPFQGNLKPKQYLTSIQGLSPAGNDRNAAAVSNGRGSLYLYIRNPDDESSWNRTSYQKLRDYQGRDILAAISERPETLFVICNREEGGIAIVSKQGEATLSAVEGGFLYRLTRGKDSLGMDEIEDRVISAREVLEKTYDKPFPYPIQWSV